ncbi:MAG: xanthine dehydrogenase FAD-binding subunit [Bacillota bacterium]|nr:xanthine dehydrogenase FAD-binding subunit [Bacillota bacterium]
MRPFSVTVPESVDEAVEALARWGSEARVIAGGTDLLVELKEDRRSPAVLVDISRLDELRKIRVEERAGARGEDEAASVGESDVVWVGTLATHAEVASSPLVRAAAPLLADACAHVGSPQIRGRGTIGGNMCTASPAGDVIPPLFVLEALVDVAGPRGVRSVGVESFFVGPKRSALAPDEIVLGVRFRALGPEHVSFFRKLGQRKSLAISVVSAAFAARRLGPDTFGDARVAFGAVAPTVVRARTVEKALGGKRLDAATARYISRLAFRDVMPITDIRGSQAYRQEMACNLLYEGLLGLLSEGASAGEVREG